MNSEALVMKNVCKDFKVLNRHEGLKGSIKDLFSRDYKIVSAVKDVSLTVNQGEIIGYLGPNGAGKSTLLKTLRGILLPLSGRIRLMGRPLTEQSDRDIALSVAYLQQHVNISFGYSVREIVMTGRYPYLKWWEKETGRDEAIVDACLAYTGVADLADKPLSEISGGQRQRMEIARALAIDPKFILLDEPFAGVDPIAVEDIQYIIAKLKYRNIGVIITDHNVGETLAITDRAYLLYEGTILQEGTPESLAADDDVRTKYLGSGFVLKRSVSVQRAQEEYARKLAEAADTTSHSL